VEKKRRNLVFTTACTLCVLFGSIMAFAVDVPEKLREVPLYQGSTIRQAMDMANSAMMTATVNAKPGAISDFYKKTMTAQGWKVIFQAEQEDVKIVHFQKDKRIFQVTIQIEKGKDESTYHLMMTSQ